MATPSAFKSVPVRKTLDVFLGQAESPLGRLIFVKDGQREFSQFAYSPAWLTHPRCFDVSPDLSRTMGYQLHKPPTQNGSCFWSWKKS